MKKLCLFSLLLLLFELHHCLPIKTCYFDKYDDKIKRDVFPFISKPKADCCGETVTLGYVNNNYPANPKFLFGARHIADLILSRTGDFVNWDDPAESELAFGRTICVCHLDELFSKFDQSKTKHVKYFRKCGKEIPACSLTQQISGHHFGENRIPKSHLTRQESEAILKTVNHVVQTGIPLCDACKNWATDKLEQYQKRKICEEQQTCHSDFTNEIQVDATCDIPKSGNSIENGDGTREKDESSDNENDKNDADYVPVSTAPKTTASKGKTELLSFAQAVGVDTRFGLVSRIPFENLQRQSQRKKIKAGTVLYNKMSSLIAPGNEKFFKHDICYDAMDGWISPKNLMKEEYLRNLSALYNDESDKEFKLRILSHMVPLLSESEIQEYVKITPYYYKKATEYAANPTITKAPHIGYERWDHQQLEYFIQFITGPTVVTGLPYKSKTAELSNGQKVDIPNLLRLQRSKQIIELYKKKLDSENLKHLLLPESTMYKILKFCVATKTKSLKCVDYYLVDAGEAVEKLIRMTNKWEAEDILTVYESKVLKNRIQESFRYLRTDFVLNLKSTSDTGSHCMNNALSAPNEASFSNSCSNDDSHEHTKLCTRCSGLKDLMRDLIFIAKTRMSETPSTAGVARKREVEDDVVKVESYVEKLEEYRKHVIRSVHSRQTWGNIVKELNDETALLTLDWAQKLEPKYYRESQTKYFGKKGIGYHIIHVLVKIGEFLAEHTFVHIIESATQKSYEVLAILDDAVGELKKMGIKNFVARSDNAACYRSTEIIMGLQKVAENNDVKIARWSFSEVQQGKGSCDRKAGVVKSRVEEYVSQKHDVATAENFYQALTEPFVIPHMTIAHATVKKTGTAKVVSFPNIQLYTDYQIVEDGVIAFKASKIGRGLKISSTKYGKDIKIADLEVTNWITPTMEENVNKHSEAFRIKQGSKTKFWKTIKDPLAQNEATHDPLAFPCPEEFCDAKFITVDELNAHVESGNHTLRKPERETLRNHALKLYQQCANDLLEESNELSAAQITFCATANENQDASEDTDFLEGNALRTGKKKCNAITEKARTFVKNLFDMGEKDASQKVSHDKAVQMMEDARDPKDPSLPLFRATELLSSQQINGLFTRFKKSPPSKTSKKRKHDDEEELSDIDCGDEEEEDDSDIDEAESGPPSKKPSRITSRRGLKNRLQNEEEQEVEEIRKEARKAASMKKNITP